MIAEDVYLKLDEDFILPGLSDDWFPYMGSIAGFITDTYKERSMGLVCNNTAEITKVYTAVFPSEKVTRSLLDGGETDILLFVHHPSIWAGVLAPEIFTQIDPKTLQLFRERRISIYNLHVPLDNYSEYSTTVNYARALGLKIEKPFGEYYGAIGGVFAQTNLHTLSEMNSVLEKTVGHRTGVYTYGGEQLEGRVAVIAGGGMIMSFLEEIAREGVHTLVTGITVRNEYSEARHAFAEANGINLLGGTHYSTEKFACIAMCGFFEKLGLPAQFVEDFPNLDDM